MANPMQALGLGPRAVPLPTLPTPPPPPPMFGQQQQQGADLRKKAQSQRAAAFGGSLLGSQLTAASTGQKTLLGATG